MFCLSIAGVFLCTLANEQFMVTQIKQTNYTKNVTNEINQRIQAYHQEAGVTPEVLAEVVPETLVKENMNEFIQGLYRNEEVTLSGESEVEAKLNRIIDTYKVKPEDENTQANEELAIYMITGIFQRSVQPNYLEKFVEKILSVKEILLSSAYIVIGIFSLFMISLIYLLRHSFKRLIQVLAGIVLASGGQLLLLGGGLFLISPVQISGQMVAFHQLMTSYTQAFALTLLAVAALEVSIGGLILIGTIIHSKVKK